MSYYSEGYQDGLKAALNFAEMVKDYSGDVTDIIEAINKLMAKQPTQKED